MACEAPVPWLKYKTLEVFNIVGIVQLFGQKRYYLELKKMEGGFSM